MALFGLRAAAFTADLLLFAPLLSVWLLLLDSTGIPASSFAENTLMAGWLLLVCLCFTLLEGSPKRATLGKMICGLTVTDVRGGRLSQWEAGKRTLFVVSPIVLLVVLGAIMPFLHSPLFLLLCYGFGFATSLWTPHNQSIFDKISGSVVSRTQESRGLVAAIHRLMDRAAGLVAAAFHRHRSAKLAAVIAIGLVISVFAIIRSTREPETSVGNLVYQAELAFIYEDYARAAKLFRKAADRGHPDACYKYAELLSVGKGVKKDEEEAKEYFIKAAEGRSMLGQHPKTQQSESSSTSRPRPSGGLSLRSTGPLRQEVRAILAQRYQGQPGLQSDIEQGVMSLHDIYPELSAAQLIRKFESMAAGY